ncbi:MAG TPA: aldehyde dehydrogenase family protein, partial [Vicinamibacteria bacterium]
MTQHDLFIGGSWVKGATYRPNLNPSNLDESVGEFAHADEAAAKDAIAAARAAFPQWSRSNIQARADALDR